MPAEPPPASVLVYSMGEVIGDGLIKLPVVGALREAFPGAKIAWCAAKGVTVYAGALAPVVAGCIDEILTETPTGAAPFDWLTPGRPFGGRRFDVVIDTQENARRSLVARRAASRLFVSGAAGGLLSHRKPPKPRPEHVVSRLLQLVSLAAGRAVEARPIALSDERAGEASRALLPEGRVYVGFAPGAGGADKRWPLDRYLELAARQAARGRTPVFFVGPQEEREAAAIRTAVPDALTPEIGRADRFGDVSGPLLVIALAGRLAAAVANDAGPGHMLAAGGAPLLSLQRSRRKARKFAPTAERLEMLVAEDYDSDAGMAAIPLADAEGRLEQLLEAA